MTSYVLTCTFECFFLVFSHVSFWLKARCRPETGDRLEERVCALPRSYTLRFGEICWAQGGVGYGWYVLCPNTSCTHLRIDMLIYRSQPIFDLCHCISNYTGGRHASMILA
jgi:hypothetical protein